MASPLTRLRSVALAATVAASFLALAALTAAAPTRLRAQTVTTGAIEGVATDSAGKHLAGVDVSITDRATGWTRTFATDVSGAYRSVALAPGRYDLLAECLGYRPLLVRGVTVGPGAAVTLDVRLTAAELPVTQVDTIIFVEGATHASLAQGTWDPGRELVDLVDPLGRLTSLGTLASISTGGLGLAGLPDRMGALGVDGLPSVAAAHPGATRTDLSALAVPFASVGHAETVAGTDVEWPGFGGGLISAFTARAPRTTQMRSYGDVAGSSLRGGVVLGGPLVRDTALVLIGVDARRVETKFDSPWADDSLSRQALAVAHDSLGTDLSAYLQPVTERTDILTTFGRFDWAIANGHSVGLRAALADRTTSDMDLGSGRPLGLGASLHARDVLASGVLTSRLSSSLEGQLSFAFDRSEREYYRPTLTGTVLPQDGLFAGADGALPGRFERNTTRAQAAVLYRHGPHAVKVGLVGSWTDHDVTYSAWQAGEYLFGSVSDFARRRGAFVQAVGGVPAASFSVTSVAFFLQDAWSPVPGLDILFGARLEREKWPNSGVTPNVDWYKFTGLANVVALKPKQRLSPRFGFTWSAGPRREWLLRGDAGIFAEEVDPSVLAEMQTNDGAVKFRRGLGALGAWPGVPDSTAAPVTGPSLTVLQPNYEAPRTSRVSLSIARNLGAATTVAVAGQYRHTDFLARRSDLNLASARQVRDQFGRPMYGALAQYGALLAAQPGSYSRFGAFDRVWSLDPSGYSNYYGLTLTLEHLREQGLSVWASYTYSRTTDNIPGALGSVPDAQLSPFPDSTGSADWRDGRSDLDVPHRAALGAEWAIGAVRVAGLLRYRSGVPFTPGFRDGVDANGDGAWGNDPAFVSDTVLGAADVIAAHGCLRSQIGSFAGRNSCRRPGVVSVDARLVLRLFTFLGGPTELVVDGLNLVSTDDGVVDRALYLVDASRTLTTNAAGTVMTVPLVANPNFGKLLVRRSAATVVRAGVRVSF